MQRKTALHMLSEAETTAFSGISRTQGTRIIMSKQTEKGGGDRSCEIARVSGGHFGCIRGKA